LKYLDATRHIKPHERNEDYDDPDRAYTIKARLKKRKLELERLYQERKELNRRKRLNLNDPELSTNLSNNNDKIKNTQELINKNLIALFVNPEITNLEAKLVETEDTIHTEKWKGGGSVRRTRVEKRQFPSCAHAGAMSVCLVVLCSISALLAD
jgi:hypothetical protein